VAMGHSMPRWRLLCSRSCRLAAPRMMKMGRDKGLRSVSHGGSGRRVGGRTGACEPVLQSGPDVDTNPGLLPPTVGEHAEQIVALLDVPRRQLFCGGAPWTRCLPR